MQCETISPGVTSCFHRRGGLLIFKSPYSTYTGGVFFFANCKIRTFVPRRNERAARDKKSGAVKGGDGHAWARPIVVLPTFRLHSRRRGNRARE
jgi:hypothetical protein